MNLFYKLSNGTVGLCVITAAGLTGYTIIIGMPPIVALGLAMLSFIAIAAYALL